MTSLRNAAWAGRKVENVPCRPLPLQREIADICRSQSSVSARVFMTSHLLHTLAHTCTHLHTHVYILQHTTRYHNAHAIQHTHLETHLNRHLHSHTLTQTHTCTRTHDAHTVSDTHTLTHNYTTGVFSLFLACLSLPLYVTCGCGLQAQCQLTPEAEAELKALNGVLAKDEKSLAKVCVLV